MSPIPGADEEEAWIVDTGREWLVSDDDIVNKRSAGGQIFLLWPAVAEDVDWTIGEETVVYLLEVVNNPPAFTDTAPTTRSVDENTASATNIGAAVAATDPESDTLVYGLTGTDASSFTIDTTSGQLKTSASLDFETDSSYSVNVTVHDGKDAVGVRRHHRRCHHSRHHLRQQRGRGRDGDAAGHVHRGYGGNRIGERP